MLKKIIFLIIIFLTTSCAVTQNGPSVKKHSFQTTDGKKKLQKYNDLQYGADKQFDYRINRTEKAYRKAGYKGSKTKKKKK